MAAGIAIFGHNPFGWRIAGVIFATLMIPLIYDFSKLRVVLPAREGDPLGAQAVE